MNNKEFKKLSEKKIPKSVKNQRNNNPIHCITAIEFYIFLNKFSR